MNTVHINGRASGFHGMTGRELQNQPIQEATQGRFESLPATEFTSAKEMHREGDVATSKPTTTLSPSCTSPSSGNHDRIPDVAQQQAEPKQNRRREARTHGSHFQQQFLLQNPTTGHRGTRHSIGCLAIAIKPYS